MKIIDADKLHYKQVYIQSEKGLRPALVVFAKEIRKMPEIVRCKDCKFAHLTYDKDAKYCDFWRDDNDFLIEVYLPSDYYCAWAERKEDGKND